MISLVNRVVGLWRGADGQTAEVVYEGSDLSGPDRWIAVDALAVPCVRIQTVMELKDGTRVLLPTNEIAHILPDRSGVLVLFKADDAPQGELMHCAPPQQRRDLQRRWLAALPASEPLGKVRQLPRRTA